MRQHCIVAGLLLAMSTVAAAATLPADLDELHQRQFRYARAMMQLNQIEGFERGPSIDAMLQHEREAKAKRAEQGWRDSADGRTQLMDEFAKAVERVATDQRAKHAMSRQWRIDEPYPSHWSVSGNEAAAADCARAIEHPLGQPLRIEMNRDGIAWLRVVAPGKGYWAFDTLVSEFDTKLSVYRDCRDIGSAAKQISDDTVGLGSIVGLEAKAAGQTFLIKLERKGGVGSLAIGKSGLSQSISGRVVRASDGMAVPGARVSAFRSGSLSLSTTADNLGFYTLNLQDPDDYHLRSRGGDREVSEVYPSAVCFSPEELGPADCEGTVVSINLANGQAVNDVDFALDLASVLSGTTIDQVSGLPIPYAEVGVIRHADSTDSYSRHEVFGDEQGRFRVGSLPPGLWRLDAASARYATERWHDVPCPSGLCPAGSGTPVYIDAGATGVVSIELDPRPYLRLRPVLNGAALAAPSITLYDQNGNYLDQSSGVWPDGSVEVGPLTGGPYRVRISATGVFSRMYGGVSCTSLSCDSERLLGTTVDLPTGALDVGAVEMQALPVVHGAVTDDATGQPIAGVRVGLYSNTGGVGMESMTDASGKYTISNPWPDQYQLRFMSERHVDEVHPDLPCDSIVAPTCPQGVVVDIAPSVPTEIVIDAALGASTQITGMILSFADNPSSSSVVADRIGQDGQVLSSHVVYRDYGSGAYELNEVPIGSHYWAIRSFGYTPQVYPGLDCGAAIAGVYQNCAFAEASILNTQLGATIGQIDFKLVSEQSRLVVVTEAETGLPLGNVMVDMWSLNHTWLGSAETDGNGKAMLRRGHEPSTELLLSTDNTLDFVNEVFHDQSCAPGTSAYYGSCALDGATPVWLWVNADPLPQIRIQLSRHTLFSDGFE